MNTPGKPERVLARMVLYRGQKHRLSVVEVRGANVSITPFVQETPRTAFYPGTVTVVDTPDGPLLSFD